MKTMTLIGLISLLVSMFAISELNGSLLIQHELSTESVLQLEGPDNELDSSEVLLTNNIALHSPDYNLVYDYKNDSILFDFTKDFFRPPSLV